MYTDEKYHEQIRLEEGSYGHSYKEIFGRCFDASVTEVHVEDSYIRSTHQACISSVVLYSTVRYNLNKIFTVSLHVIHPLQNERNECVLNLVLVFTCISMTYIF